MTADGTSERDARIVEMRRAGATYECICDELQISTNVVKNCLQRLAPDLLGWPPDRPHRCRRTARNAKIVARRERGETLASIGADFGITRARVLQIVLKYAAPSHRDERDGAIQFNSGDMESIG